MSKSNKRRACPAVQREISGAECGENRNSLYACPADCLFNPLARANYDALLELETNVDKLSTGRLLNEAKDPVAIVREFERINESDSPEDLHALITWRLFFARAADGLSCAQRWERDGFPGLKNDMRVLLRAKMKVQVTLIEVRQVLDGERLEMVDLLAADPQPFLVVDRSFASRATRFTTGLAWLYPLPHFQKIFGSLYPLHDLGNFEPRDWVTEIVRHLGGPPDGAALRHWLAENFARVQAASNAILQERQRRTFAQLDASFGKTVYELRAPYAECCQILKTVANVQSDALSGPERREGFAEAFLWLNPADAATQRNSPSVLGRVLCGQTHWRVEASSGQRTAQIRRQFEDQMGERVRFAGERVDDLAQQRMAAHPRADLSLIPPTLLGNIPEVRIQTWLPSASKEGLSSAAAVAETFREFDQSFLTQAIPALDGLTPHEAAQNPRLRPRLIGLMKGRVRATDERNLQTGRNDDVNWMLQELGLDELIFPAPPAGRRPSEMAIADDEPEPESDLETVDENVATPMDPRLPLAPRLPPRPLTGKEIDERIFPAMAQYKRATDAMMAMESAGCTLIADVDAATEDLVNTNVFPILVPLLIQMWLVFVPPGTRGPNLARTVLRQTIQRELQQIVASLEPRKSSDLKNLLWSGPQPEFTNWMISMQDRGIDSMPKKQRPSDDQALVLVAVIRSVIAELDRAHRRFWGE